MSFKILGGEAKPPIQPASMFTSPPRDPAIDPDPGAGDDDDDQEEEGADPEPSGAQRLQSRLSQINTILLLSIMFLKLVNISAERYLILMRGESIDNIRIVIAVTNSGVTIGLILIHLSIAAEANVRHYNRRPRTVGGGYDGYHVTQVEFIPSTEMGKKQDIFSALLVDKKNKIKKLGEFVTYDEILPSLEYKTANTPKVLKDPNNLKVYMNAPILAGKRVQTNKRKHKRNKKTKSKRVKNGTSSHYYVVSSRV